MDNDRSLYPKLRHVDKVKPPYRLNDFPAGFAYKLSEEIVYLLATRGTPDLEGKDWEHIFAKSIGAEWKPSNVGLDDVVLDTCAWGAKTVKANNSFRQTKVRLISGRNSPIYSFGGAIDLDNADLNLLGKQVLEIWNERVSDIRRKYKHARTVVLIKSHDLTELVIFEFDTLRFDPDLYYWKLNRNKNLEGFLKSTNQHCFTWQSHGSQFTIIEDVPEDHLAIRIKKPGLIEKADVIESIGFDETWLEIIRGKRK